LDTTSKVFPHEKFKEKNLENRVQYRPQRPTRAEIDHKAPQVRQKEGKTMPRSRIDDTDDTDEQALAELDPAGHAPYQRWSEATREKAAALLAIGTSMRQAARILGVPRSTLQKFRISDDPAAQPARGEQLADTIAESGQLAREMLQKIRDAPVRSVAEAAVAFGILVEKTLLLVAHQEAMKGHPGKKSAMDLFELIEKANEEKRLRASVVPPPPALPEKIPPE